MEQIDVTKRLDNIDHKLDDIQKLMIDTALQQKDIDLLKEEVKALKAEQRELRSTVFKLQSQPAKEKADRWSTIEKWILGGVLTFIGSCVVYIIKVGFIGNVLK